MSDRLPASAQHNPDLRREAQQRLSGAAGATQLALEESDRQRLIHELQVHQIELEMQNEVLRDTLAQTQTLKAKYQDLYDCAPVGYFTLTAGGEITEINRRGAALLGLDPHGAVGRPIQASFSDDSLAQLERLMQRARQGQEGAVHDLRLRKRQAMPLYVNAQAHAFTDTDGHTTVRLVLMDVSALKMATDDVAQAILEKAQRPG